MTLPFLCPIYGLWFLIVGTRIPIQESNPGPIRFLSFRVEPHSHPSSPESGIPKAWSALFAFVQLDRVNILDICLVLPWAVWPSPAPTTSCQTQPKSISCLLPPSLESLAGKTGSSLASSVIPLDDQADFIPNSGGFWHVIIQGLVI